MSAAERGSEATESVPLIRESATHLESADGHVVHPPDREAQRGHRREAEGIAAAINRTWPQIGCVELEVRGFDHVGFNASTACRDRLTYLFV